MRLIRLTVLLFFVLSLVYSAAALSPISVEVNRTESTDTIRSDESASFLLEITNNQEFKDDIYLSAPRSKWHISFEDYYIPLNAKWVAKTKMRAAPPINTPPGKYAIYVEIKSATNSTVKDYRYLHVFVTSTADLPDPKTELTIIEKEATDSWIKRSYSIFLNNTGETTIENEWTETFTELELYLIASNPEYSGVSDYGKNKRVAWAYSLEPGESTTLSYSVSYIPLLAGGLLLVVALILFGVYYSSSFRLTKSVRVSQEGGRKSLKTEIIVKNKTGKPQKNVVVEDYIPVPFNLVKKFITIEPDSVSKQKNYIKLTWKFSELAPREERVLSYQIQSKLRVIGKITLPPAVLTQKVRKGERQAFSTPVDIVGR